MHEEPLASAAPLLGFTCRARATPPPFRAGTSSAGIAVAGMLELSDPAIIATLKESLAGPEPGASAVAKAVTAVSSRWAWVAGYDMSLSVVGLCCCACPAESTPKLLCWLHSGRMIVGWLCETIQKGSAAWCHDMCTPPPALLSQGFQLAVCQSPERNQDATAAAISGGAPLASAAARGLARAAQGCSCSKVATHLAGARSLRGLGRVLCRRRRIPRLLFDPPAQHERNTPPPLQGRRCHWRPEPHSSETLTLRCGRPGRRCRPAPCPRSCPAEGGRQEGRCTL